DHALVAERREVVRDREGRAAGPDQRDALAVLRVRRLRQARAHVAAIVRRDALQAADRDGLLLDSAAPACGLARAGANATQYPREDVRLAIEHVRVVEAAERDQTDVLGHVGVGRTRPLAIDDTMEEFACGVRRIHR